MTVIKTKKRFIGKRIPSSIDLSMDPSYSDNNREKILSSL